MAVWIDSEINRLKRVIIHSPGHEIEAMSPATARHELYNDIIPLSVVAEEHRELSGFLSLISQVSQVRDLLAEILRKEEGRTALIGELALRYGIYARKEELSGLSPDELADICITGLKKSPRTLSDYLDPREFDILPLPNLYFTRDSAMVYRNRMIIGSMARGVRNMEAVIFSLICTYHELFADTEILFHGSGECNGDCSLEGGDFIVLAPDLLLIGVSERTTPRALDILIQKIGRNREEPFTVFAVILPKDRATIHLDMVCTQIDKNTLLVHAPVITDHGRSEVIKIEVSGGSYPVFRRVDGLVEGLKEIGREMEVVVCGGKNPVFQQREQWLSGANMLTFAPGKVIGYSCNNFTFEELDRQGYAVKKAARFLAGKEKVEDYPKLAVQIDAVELARGGGGIRCMTMPIERTL